MLILGLNRGDHEASACLVKDGVLLAFIANERITRIKHDAGRIWEAVHYCLECTSMDYADIDLVVQNSYCKDITLFEKYYRSRFATEEAPTFLRQFNNVVTISHHLAHAWCGVALSDFKDSAVMVVDGMGQALDGKRYEAESYYYYQNCKIETLHKRYGTLKNDDLGFHSFDSIGGIYSAVSSYIFGHWNRCGKVMGLAPYGRKNIYNWKIISKSGKDLFFDMDFRKDLKHPNMKASDWDDHRDEYENISYTIQKEVEKALIYMANWLYKETMSKNLIICGGVGLNCVANQNILSETPFEKVFIPPPCADDGISIGCAYYGWFEKANGKKVFSFCHPYYGKKYQEKEIAKVLSAEPLIDYQRLDCIEKKAAKMLEEGNIIGWFQGAGAMGPRALGNRSILADPRKVAIRDAVNNKVKNRETFRPFGASVLAEYTSQYFDSPADRYYMTFAVHVNPAKANEIPAVVHKDNTCRIQTVTQKINPKFYRLIKAFYRITGVPLVLNTSFNLKGEPIVETPFDALACFLASNMDFLCIGDFLVRKKKIWENDGSVNPEILGWSIVAKRKINLIRHIYPGGDSKYSIASYFPTVKEIDHIDEGLLPIMNFFETDMRLTDMFKAMHKNPDSAYGKKVINFLLELKKRDLIAFVLPNR